MEQPACALPSTCTRLQPPATTGPAAGTSPTGRCSRLPAHPSRLGCTPSRQVHRIREQAGGATQLAAQVARHLWQEGPGRVLHHPPHPLHLRARHAQVQVGQGPGVRVRALGVYMVGGLRSRGCWQLRMPSGENRPQHWPGRAARWEDEPARPNQPAISWIHHNHGSAASLLDDCTLPRLSPPS